MAVPNPLLTPGALSETFTLDLPFFRTVLYLRMPTNLGKSQAQNHLIVDVFLLRWGVPARDRIG
jgi:hypothetical protein